MCHRFSGDSQIFRFLFTRWESSNLLRIWQTLALLLHLLSKGVFLKLASSGWKIDHKVQSVSITKWYQPCHQVIIREKPTLSLCLMAVSLNYFTVGFGWWNCNHFWSKNNHNIDISHLKQFQYPKDSCHQLINITWWHIINPVTKWCYHLVTNIEHWLSQARDHFSNQFFFSVSCVAPGYRFCTLQRKNELGWCRN